MVRKPLRCARCASADVKAVPDDFPAGGSSKAKWPSNSVNGDAG